jgi:hypothetical protein
MSHTNIFYDCQSDRNPLDGHSSNKEFVLSSSCLQMPHMERISDQSKFQQHQNLDNVPVSIHRSHEVCIGQQVSNNEDDSSYFSLKYLLNKRHGRRDEDSHLSQRVRNFYKEQDALIDDYERVYGGRNDKLDKQVQNLKRHTNILTKISLGINIVRIICQLVLRIECVQRNYIFIGFICTKNCCSVSFKIPFSCFICY